MDHAFYSRLCELLERRVPVALCTVVGSHGSTPQEAGAKMAVLPNAEILGTIGGGCVEAEVRRRAVRLIEERRNELISFSLDHDYGWDDGLICGGTLRVLVDQLPAGRDADLFRALLNGRRTARRQVLATVVRDGGGFPGDKHLFDADGPLPPRIVDLVGAEPAAELIAKAVRRGRPAAFRLDRDGNRQLGKGAAAEETVVREVLFEPILPRVRLVIAGAGHVGQALAEMAAALEFEVVVVDDRDGYANRERFPKADELIIGDIPRALAEMDVGPQTYVVVVTRGHKHDLEALLSVVRKPAGYLGLIGSRRKIQLIFDAFRNLGVTEEQIARVHAPIGVELGSRTVPEIAVSIAAQLIQVRSSEFTDEEIRSRSARPMR